MKREFRFTRRESLLTAIMLLTSSANLYALELRYGQGDLSTGMGVASLFNMDVTLDANTISLVEPHKNLGSSKMYYHFKLDYFDSDTANRITDIASLPLTTPLPFPFPQSSFSDLVDDFTNLPVPADYRMHGIDFDIGVGYDVVDSEQTTVGLGVNAGLTTPFMETRNLLQDANFFISVLDTFNTDIRTWKVGPSLYISHELMRGVTLRGSGSWNYQTAEMDNDWLRSGIKFDGSSVNMDASVTFNAGELTGNSKLKNVEGVVGYAKQKWDYDSTTVDTPIRTGEIARPLDMDFEHSNLYMGISYKF